jgi:hypothetical protein
MKVRMNSLAKPCSTTAADRCSLPIVILNTGNLLRRKLSPQVHGHSVSSAHFLSSVTIDQSANILRMCLTHSVLRRSRENESGRTELDARFGYRFAITSADTNNTPSTA